MEEVFQVNHRHVVFTIASDGRRIHCESDTTWRLFRMDD
jgi:hypothetical protein